ncbi:MAG: tetratricopeptide repeat protein [Tepidisphaeraceae bacterium]|jgi:predicted O-linked N-acetylglucosamine transferase (SPINDLY family)
MDPLTIQQILQLALSRQQAGQFHEAEQLYRQLLTIHPEHFLALHHLGVIALQTGRNDLAIDLIRRAIAVDPAHAEVYGNLGIALNRAGKFDEAIASYQRAIALNPNLAQVHANLGNALKDKGRLNDAIAAYRQAIALKPQFPEAFTNLGNVLRNIGRLQESIAASKQAISLKPDYAEAYSNLGNALKDARQLVEAIAAYRQALALKPNFPDAQNNLGSALRDGGQLPEAITAFRQAIAQKPDFPEAHFNLGNALAACGQLDQAIAAYRQAIALRPGFADVFSNLGVALKLKGNLDEALAAYRQALALRPNFVAAHSNLVYALHYHPDYDAPAILAEHSQWDQRHAAPFRNASPSHDNDPSPDRRLKIGYVSPDFRDHVVGQNIRPLFRHHDRTLFDITCYAQVLHPDEMTRQFQQDAGSWRDIVGLSDEQVAAQIRGDRIDILVDLALHMHGSRLLVFARRPAPIQITFAGYPGTTGLTAIDFRLTDPYLDPPGEQDDFYSEKSIRLSNSFWCYDPAAEMPDVGPLPAATNGHITFGCLNNFSKVTDPTLSLWSAILRAVPRSRLILLSPHGEHRQRVLTQLAIEPSRVEIIEHQPRDQYLRTYHRIDLCLDTFPYNGHTTSLDSLWMGVPVITLCGKTAVSRAGYSQCKNLGLADELVAQTPQEFVQRAIDLAAQPNRLAELRSSLRSRMENSPLMNPRQFAANIESVYRRLWRDFCHAGAKR